MIKIERMKAILILLFVVLIPGVSGAELKGHVVINTYHNVQSEDLDYKVQTLTDLLKSGNFSVKEVRDRPLSYTLLKSYDVLVLLTPTSYFTDGEISDVLRFAQEGGGVLLIGESNEYPTHRIGNVTQYFNPDYLNTLSKKFGISFNRDTLSERRGGRIVHDVAISNFEKHAITEGVGSLNLVVAATLTLSGKAVKIASGGDTAYSQVYDIVSYPPVAAVSRYGYGRIAAVSDTEGYIQYENKFLLNAFNWLSTKSKLTEASAYLGNGTLLLSLDEYSGAKWKLESALSIYTSLEIGEKVNETRALIVICDKGINANSLMQAAYRHYENKNYTEAKAKFEDANKLYVELNNAAKIEESKNMIEKSAQFVGGISQFNEAVKYFDAGEYAKAKEAFEEAKKKFAALNNAEMVKKSEEMMLKSSRGSEALGLFALGSEQFKSKEFARAKATISQAKQVFADLGNSQKVEELQVLIEKIEKYVLAYSKYAEAEAAFNREEYEKSRDAFSGAKVLFAELGDDEMSRKSGEMAEKSISEIKERTRVRTAIVAGILVLLACGAIFVWWTGRQRKLEKAPKVKITGKTAKIKEMEGELKKLELRYAQGGLSKKEYVNTRRNLEEKIEAEERKIKKTFFK